jgi:hypothetical protein
VSPRKSSTSSGRPPTQRPRYLGIEVAGELLPPLPPRWWEATLRRCLDRAGVPDRFRVVRVYGRRAIAEVEHRAAPAARAAWSARDVESAPPLELTTIRTWGTLRGAKAWLREPGPIDGPGR